jgi:formylglycine-generating enzyme required for sulfatase activity
MAGKLFISYRRDDSAGYAGRVRDRLEGEFGQDLLFMDVDAIPLGMNFIKVLRDEVAKCDVLLAVIGPNWATLRDKEGNRRLDDQNDFVRIEVATALARDIPVIPILLDGAQIPKPEELPTDLEELAVRNGLNVRHTSFHSDMDRLIAGLRKPLGRPDLPPRESAAAAKARTASGLRRAAIAFGGGVVLAGAIFAVVVLKKQPVSLPSPPSQSISVPLQSQQLPSLVTPAPRKAEILPTPIPSPPATPQTPEVAQPAPKSIQRPVLPVLPPPQLSPPPPPEAQPAAPAALPSATPNHATLKTAVAPFAPLSPSREHALQPGDSFKECDNCPEMVVLPAGAFVMGSPEGERGRSTDESPQHVVTIARPFAAGKFEVTVDQFAAFVNETKYDAGAKCTTLEDGKSGIKEGRSWRDPGYPQTGSHPAACVSWNDAKAYLSWLAKKIGKDYRLLSEAEWEYAARATTTRGSGSRYSFGEDDSEMCRYGNVADRTARQTVPGAGSWTVFPCSDGYAYAAPVGIFAANAFGLFDVYGNVWEWTEDCYNGSYSGAPADGVAWTAGECDHRVIRGGMWGSSPASVRSARRFKDQTITRSQDIGFRVARPMEP